MSFALRREQLERRRNLEAERQNRERRTALEVEQGRSETIALCRARGEEIDTPAQGRGEAPKPARRVAGLDWLLSRKRIDGRQHMAGEKYGARVQAGSPGVGSCLDVREGVGMSGSAPYTLAEVVSFATMKLREDRRDGLLNIGYLIEICDSVCGDGLRPGQLGGTQREAEKIEARLLVGLDMLAIHYGL